MMLLACSVTEASSKSSLTPHLPQTTSRTRSENPLSEKASSDPTRSPPRGEKERLHRPKAKRGVLVSAFAAVSSSTVGILTGGKAPNSPSTKPRNSNEIASDSETSGDVRDKGVSSSELNAELQGLTEKFESGDRSQDSRLTLEEDSATDEIAAGDAYSEAESDATDGKLSPGRRRRPLSSGPRKNHTWNTSEMDGSESLDMGDDAASESERNRRNSINMDDLDVELPGSSASLPVRLTNFLFFHWNAQF